MTKHTPGPWKAEPHQYSHGDKVAVVDVDGRIIVTTPGPRNRTDKANARLIAAAPDLLAALREAFTMVCYLKPERYDNPEHEADFQAKLDQFEAAMHKAEGQKVEVATDHLREAAPDLLAACQMVLDAGDDGCDMGDLDWDQIRGAVAKAKGEK